jgi:Fe-S oxidoreductase
MTVTYDPFHPKYFDESDLREELTRVYDLCHGCRLCFKFCTSFPTLFSFVDQHDDQDVSKLTVAEQDQVVDECFNCKLCYINCPYTPDMHEWQLDFPRLMMRAEQVLHQNGHKTARGKLTDKALGSTDLVGTLSSTAAPLANKAIATPDSPVRKALEKVTGISSTRILPPYVRQRFSTWMKKRTGPAGSPAKTGQGRAAIFPTCLVEYQDAGVGKDLVKVYEHNGIECTLPEGQVCCGAPMLHQGDLKGFRKLARKNIPILAAAIRGGNDVVVPQPTCGYVLKKDYVDYIGGPDAQLVADNTYDACEYLIKVHKADDTELSTDFPGPVPETTTYHAPCHLRAQEIGLKSRDLMKLTGTKLKVVAECSAIDGTWGLRAENIDAARKVAKKMADQITKADSEAVTGDCTLANGAIRLETGEDPLHPLQFVARAYGLPEDS